jgi:hypothetical protein
MRDIFSSRIDSALIFRESVHRRCLLLPSIELPSLAYIASAPTTRKGFSSNNFQLLRIVYAIEEISFFLTQVTRKVL